MTAKQNKKELTRYLSPSGAWALALGTSVGWGSLVVTSNTYLAQAGPLGSVLGIILGALIMLVISRNYSYMMNCCPDAGGAYAFTREAFGYDHGFLTAWFLALVYMAMLWANATSLPLFARYFLGDTFKFCLMYSIFGYDVYLGEMFLSVAAIVLISALCLKSKKVIEYVMIVLVLLFFIGISVCFAAALLGHGSSAFSSAPLFVPDINGFSQVIHIACISPWAFIGYENISHSSEEFKFHRRKSFRILTIAVITTTLLYIFVTLLSITAYPSEYGSWLEYIRDLNNIEGIKGLPAFYAADHYLGNAGITLLILSLLALIITSLIGNIVSLSRLLYALAKDNILPAGFSELNKNNVPHRTVALIAVISMLIPFLGRTAIGWIVDVTTIGATIIYGFVSASALKTARQHNDRITRITGSTGLVIMIVFGLMLLLPELFASGSIEKETYFLFTVWAILGFVIFRIILKMDKENRFGKSVVVWIALLSLILFTSLVWLSQSMMSLTSDAVTSVSDYYHSLLDPLQHTLEEEAFIAQEMKLLRMSNIRSMLVVTGFFGVSLCILINNYSLMRKRADENERELEQAKNTANIDALTGAKSKRAYAEAEKRLNEDIEIGVVEAFAIIVCDINGLKYINDTYGHKAGDEYIRAACRQISSLFKRSPIYRIGGDEFVVIAMESDYDERHAIMKELGDSSEAAIGTDNVVVSAGLSDFIRGNDEKVISVFERADVIMYERKKRLKEMGARIRD